MIFTRYLYIKEEVENALLISLFKKDANNARFWYEELTSEGNDTLLQIYFDFYFTNNFGLTDLTDLLNTKYEYNLDIYLLKKYVLELDKNENDVLDEDEFITFSIWIKERKYKQLAKYILRDCDEFILPYTLKHIGVSIKEFNSVIKMLESKDKVKKYNRSIYLSFIMRFFLLEKKREEEKEEEEKEEENISINIEEKQLPYIEVDISDEKGWQKLPHIQKYDIDKYNYLCLFSKDRLCREELLDRYRNHWLYYASFSLLWKERIEKYKGIIDSEKRNVIFPLDELCEEFYTLYGLEPDEQSVVVQNKSIPVLKYDDAIWSTFCKEFTSNSLIIL